MAKCLIPLNQLEPWHAIFIPSASTLDSPYKAATRYGAALVDLGLINNYLIIGHSKGGEITYHCIPPAPGKSAADYWKQLFDTNY